MKTLRYSLSLILLALLLNAGKLPSTTAQTAADLPTAMDRPAVVAAAPAGPIVELARVGEDRYAGPITAITIRGTVAYAGIGTRLVLLDITNPVQPNPIRQSPEMIGTLSSVVVAGNYAYVLADQLHIFDISQPALVQVGLYPLPSNYSPHNGMAVSGHYLYLALGDQYLRVIDVANPAAPFQAGVYNWWGEATAGRVAVAGHYAYVAGENGGLRILDIADPPHPTETGSLQVRGDTYNVAVAGNYAYLMGINIAGHGAGLYTVDISNAAAPVQLGYTDNGVCSWTLVVSSPYAYCLGGIFDVSVPAAPTLVSSWSPKSASSLALSGNYLYLACGTEGLSITNTANLAAPKETTYGGMGDDFYGVEVSGNYAYAADGARGLKLIDITNPATPTLSSGILASRMLFGLEAISVAGNYVYFPGGDALGAIDVSNPLNPIDVTPAVIYRDPTAVAAAGHYVFLISWLGLMGPFGLHILDVSTLSAPTVVGNFKSAALPRHVTVAGNTAYLWGSVEGDSGNFGLMIVDVTNLSAPTQTGYYESDDTIRDLVIRGNLTYVVDGGFHIVDLSNPASPVDVSAYQPAGAAYSRIAVQGNYAYILDILDGLHILDISAPTQPFPVAYYPLTEGRDVAAEGNSIYVVTRMSFISLRFAPPSASIQTSGGILTSLADATTYLFAAETFTNPVQVTHSSALPGYPPASGEHLGIDHQFEVSAVDAQTGEAVQPKAGQVYTLTVHFTAAEAGAARKDSLALYNWDGNSWEEEPSSTVDVTNNVITATPSHFSLWAVLGNTQRHYLPLAAANGSDYPRQLTAGAGNVTLPVFSPDGQTVVFVSDRDGETDIFRMPAGGGHVSNLTQTLTHQDDRPVFSPDGQTIAYATTATPTGYWAIYLMRPDGTLRRAAISSYYADVTQPFFTADGQGLIFASNLMGNWDIYSATIGAQSDAWVRLTTNPATDRLPELSPDGSTIVFRSERDGNSNVYLMRADGTNQRPFTTSSAFDGLGTFVPDGSGLVFDSNRSGTWNSYCATLAGTVTKVYETRPGWQMQYSSVSKDQRWRVYADAPIGNPYNLFVDRFTCR